jgi:hypothetical protein
MAMKQLKTGMTFDDVLADPELERFHGITRFLMENENTIFFPEKFMSSLKTHVAIKLKELNKQEPNLTLLQVVLKTIKGMNEHMTEEMINEIVAFTMTRWQYLQAKSQQIEPTATVELAEAA